MPGPRTVSSTASSVNRYVMMSLLLLPLMHAGNPTAGEHSADDAAGRPPTPDPTFALHDSPPQPVAPTTSNAWIWHGQPEVPADVFFRRRFELAGRPAAASLHAACDDSAVGWVNGTPLDRGRAIRGYTKMKRFDVAALLRRGTNVVAFMATNRGGPAGLLVVLEWTDSNGKRHRIESDPRWRATREKADGWTAIDFNDREWPAAQAFGYPPSPPWGVPDGYPGQEAPSPLKTLSLQAERVVAAEHARIDDADALLKRDGKCAVFQPAVKGDLPRPSVIVDFGREIAGGVRVHGKNTKPARFHLQVGESFSEVTHPAVNAHAWFETTATLTAKTPIHFGGTAFRFCRLTLLDAEGPVAVDAVVAGLEYYPVVYRGGFDCSDSLLTRIWYTAAYTTHLCMQEGLWDAPKRDRMEWMGDIHPQARVIGYAFGDTALLRKTLDRLRGPTPMTEQINGVPAYTMWWVIALRDLYDFTGDRAWLESRRDKLVATCDWIAKETDDRGVFANRNGGWVFLDWGSLSAEDSVAGTHMILVKALADGAFLCEQFGDRANARRFRKAANSARRAAREHLFDESTGAFTTRKQVNALALFAGVCPRRMARRINRNVLAPDDDQIVTPYYNYYVLWARAMAGDHRGALDFMRDYWGAMLEAGATTFWEVFDKRWLTDPPGILGPGPAEGPDTHANLDAFAYKGYRISLCHGWSAGPAAWLSAEVLGVKPAEPGFSEIEISPHLAGLEWAEGKVPTPHGIVWVRHEHNGDRFLSRITLPAGTSARLGIPRRRGKGVSVRVNGKATEPKGQTGRFVYVDLEGGRTYRVVARYGKRPADNQPFADSRLDARLHDAVAAAVRRRTGRH